MSAAAPQHARTGQSSGCRQNMFQFADISWPGVGEKATHCGHGQRAATGLSVLERRGYRNLALISEGIEEWREAGGPVERGTPIQREATRA